MLSDTLSENINFDAISDDLRHYERESDTYEYPRPLLDEVQRLTDRLREIQLKLDSGYY